MFSNVIGAEIKKAGRQYSSCGVAVIGDSDFITSDIDAISVYNTDVFCEIGTAVVPVYSNLADIPASRLPNGLSIKITDEAYPPKARWVNTNFRVEYLGGLSSSPGECPTCSVGQPIGILPVLIPLIPLMIKVAAIIVVSLAVAFVIAQVRSAILAWMLPGGVSGHEREIDDTHKLITYPDGSWALWDTEKGEAVDGGDKPEDWVTSLIIPIVLGVAGIAGIYIFVKWGMPAIAGALPPPKPKPGAEAEGYHYG